jgi:hypothetical protein
MCKLVSHKSYLKIFFSNSDDFFSLKKRSQKLIKYDLLNKLKNLEKKLWFIVMIGNALIIKCDI